MATSISFLNYFAFFSLFIICFVFFYQKFSEIVGFSILIVVNIAFLFYLINDLMTIFDKTTYFVPMVAVFSLIVGLVFNTVLLIFILMVANTLQVKYTKKYGTPLNLPMKYKNKMELIKRFMISCFCLGSVILYMLFYKLNDINHSLYTIIKYISIKNFIIYKEVMLIFIASMALMGMSSYQVYAGNSFTLLSRNDLSDKQ